ncbi:hypothetical protein [Lacunimicrobium album]
MIAAVVTVVPRSAHAKEALDLIELVPEDVGVIVEVNDFAGLLNDVETSGLWDKVKVFPVVHQWLSSEKFKPLSRLKGAIERETGQPLREFLSELASERFLIVIRPSTTETSENAIEAAMILRPASEKSIETLLLLHNSSQRTQPVFGFLNEYVVVATDQTILDAITLCLENHQRGVTSKTARAVRWSKSSFDLPNIRAFVHLDTWSDDTADQDDEFFKLFLQSFQQMEMVATLDTGLTLLVSLHKSHQESVDSLTAQDVIHSVTAQDVIHSVTASPTVMLSVRGMTCPADVVSLIDRVVEEKDRQEWENFRLLGKMIWGEDHAELLKAWEQPWRWSLAVTLTASTKEIGPQNLLDATWTVLLPEMSAKLKERIDRVASSTVNMAAVSAYTERKMTPEVKLMVQEGATQVTGMWLESILGMTPGYAMTDNSFTVATLMSQFDVTKIDTREPAHDFEMVFRPKLVKAFLNSRSDSVKPGSRVKEDVMKSHEYRVLLSLLDIFAEIQMTTDDEPTRVRMALSGRVDSAESKPE